MYSKYLNHPIERTIHKWMYPADRYSWTSHGHPPKTNGWNPKSWSFASDELPDFISAGVIFSLELKWPLFWLEVRPCFEGLTFKNRGHWGSRRFQPFVLVGFLDPGLVSRKSTNVPCFLRDHFNTWKTCLKTSNLHFSASKPWVFLVRVVPYCWWFWNPANATSWGW